MSLEPILHPSVLLGPVLLSPELLQPVLKLEPPVFLKMLVLGIVLLELVLLPSVDGGQRHLLAKGKSLEKWICGL